MCLANVDCYFNESRCFDQYRVTLILMTPVFDSCHVSVVVRVYVSTLYSVSQTKIIVVEICNNLFDIIKYVVGSNFRSYNTYLSQYYKF
jgi:hypothetical protein